MRGGQRNIPWAHLVNTLHQNGASVAWTIIALTLSTAYTAFMLWAACSGFTDACLLQCIQTSFTDLGYPMLHLVHSQSVSKPLDSIGPASSDLTFMGSKCRQMVEPVEGHQTHNLVVAAEITRQVGIQTMSATDFLILPSPQPWPRAMLQGAHWGRRDSRTCLVTLGYVEHPQCKFLSPGPALCIHSC